MMKENSYKDMIDIFKIDDKEKISALEYHILVWEEIKWYTDNPNRMFMGRNKVVYR